MCIWSDEATFATNEKFVSQFPELAIVNALDYSVFKRAMPSFFKICGYKKYFLQFESAM